MNTQEIAEIGYGIVLTRQAYNDNIHVKLNVWFNTRSDTSFNSGLSNRRWSCGMDEENYIQYNLWTVIVYALILEIPCKWKGHWNLIYAAKFSSLAALQIVITTTSSVASDKNFVNMTTVTVQCELHNNHTVLFGSLYNIYLRNTATALLFTAWFHRNDGWMCTFDWYLNAADFKGKSNSSPGTYHPW